MPCLFRLAPTTKAPDNSVRGLLRLIDSDAGVASAESRHESEFVVQLHAADDGLILEFAGLGVFELVRKLRFPKINKEAFQPDGPVPAQHVLHAATNGPARPGL